MGKNKKNRQKQQNAAPTRQQIPTFTSSIENSDSPTSKTPPKIDIIGEDAPQVRIETLQEEVEDQKDKPQNLDNATSTTKTPTEEAGHLNGKQKPIHDKQTRIDDQNGKDKDGEEDRAQRIREEVERRRAIAEAAVRVKKPAQAHNRLTFFPFAYALRNENLHLFCWYCLREYDQVRLRPCGGRCKIAWFCNEKCESLARKDHRPECDGYKRLSPKVEAPDVEVRLLGRIAHRYKQIQCGLDSKITEFYKHRTSQRTIMEIWAHEKNFAQNEHYRQQFEEFYAKLASFYAPEDLPTKEEIFKLHCRDFVNRHAISDVHYQNEIGKGLYLDLCSYDHSCRPDTIFYSIGFKSILVGLAPRADISDNRQSFYSYVDLMSTHAQRQRQLKDTWFFECRCTRCTDPYDHILTALKCEFCFELDGTETPVFLQGEKMLKSQEGRTLCPKCRRAQDSAFIVESNYLMRDIGLFMDQATEGTPPSVMEAKLKAFLVKSDRLLPSINSYRTRVILSYVNYAQIGEEQRARVFVSTEPCLRYCFPSNHPGLAFYLRDVAYFCAMAHFFEDSIQYLSEALDIMERIFVEHEAIQSMRQKLAEFQKKNALQKESGKTRRLNTRTKPKLTIEKSPSPAPQIQLLSVNEPKNQKDRGHHQRRIHRAPTPLPPTLLEDAVQFTPGADD